MRSSSPAKAGRKTNLRPHPEERALPAAHLRCPVRASRRMAASTCFASILRDASLRDAPQDEVGDFHRLDSGRSSIPGTSAIEPRSRGVLDTPDARGMTTFVGWCRFDALRNDDYRESGVVAAPSLAQMSSSAKAGRKTNLRPHPEERASRQRTCTVRCARLEGWPRAPALR